MASFDSSSTVQSDELTSFGDRLKDIIYRWLIRDFSPMYFVSTMAMGITSCIMYDFPYESHWIRICGWIFFVINVITFIILSIFMIISIKVDPSKFVHFHTNPQISPFMGCIAMGYMTIVNFFWSITQDLPHAAIIIWIFWWISVIISIYTSCIVFLFSFIIKHENNKIMKFEDLHLTILLPIVALTVSSVQGNLILLKLPTLNLQLLTIIITMILLSIAICVSFVIITVNFWKLFVYKLPPTNLIFTSFFPIGLLGQASFGMSNLGHNFHQIILSTNVDNLSNYLASFDYQDLQQLKLITSNVFLIFFLIIALFLLSFGYFMTFVAVSSVLSKSPPFAKNPNPKFVSKYGNLVWFRGYWAMTFPLGTMSLAQSELHKLVGSGIEFFRVMSTIYAIALFLVTISCMLGVIHTLYFELKWAWNYKPEKTQSV